jgi:hypothetical protein
VKGQNTDAAKRSSINAAIARFGSAHGGINYDLKTTEAAERDAEIERLAKMPVADYEQARKEAAKRLGMRVAVLDEAVEKARFEHMRRVRATPEAIEAERRRIEAEMEAARITRNIERERLWQSCNKLAMSQTLLTDIENICHRLGVVREGAAIRAIYLAATSRLGAQVICLIRTGVSAGGKNYPIEVILKLIPEDSIIRASSGSPLSLIYMPGGENAYRLKIIYIPEAAFLAERNGVESLFTYLLRTLMSEGRLDHHVTVPQANGPPVTEHIKRNGPVVIILTSARPIEDELLTRLVVSEADESQAQVVAVVTKDRNAGKPDEAELEQMRDLQRWLELDAPYKVVVPFGQVMSGVVVQEIMRRGGVLPQRLKRDINAIFGAIEASAILHKAQRDCDGAGRIVATLDDYDNARAAFDVGLTTLYPLKTPATALAIVEAAEALGANRDVSLKITIRALMDKAGLSTYRTARDRLYDTVERGFLLMDEPKTEKGPRFYRIGKSSTEIKAIIESGKTEHVFPPRKAIEHALALGGIPPESADQADQQTGSFKNYNDINYLRADPLIRSRLDQGGSEGINDEATVNPDPADPADPNLGGLHKPLKNKVDPPDPLDPQFRGVPRGICLTPTRRTRPWRPPSPPWNASAPTISTPPPGSMRSRTGAGS